MLHCDDFTHSVWKKSGGCSLPSAPDLTLAMRLEETQEKFYGALYHLLSTFVLDDEQQQTVLYGEMMAETTRLLAQAKENNYNTLQTHEDRLTALRELEHLLHTASLPLDSTITTPLFRRIYEPQNAISLVEEYLRTAESDNLLVHEFRRCQSTYIRERNTFAEANLGLVRFWADKYTDRGLDFEELVAEGNLGLLRAIDDYDPQRAAFSSYASRWIRRYIGYALIEKRELIRIPSRRKQRQRHWAKATNILWYELKREPAEDEIAERLQLSPQQVKNLQQLPKQPLALSKTHDGGDGESLPLEYRVSNRALDGSVPETVEEQAVRQLYCAQIRRKMDAHLEELIAQKAIRPRDRDIFLQYNSFGGGEPTLEDLGKDYGLTGERIRQINDKVTGLVVAYVSRITAEDKGGENGFPQSPP